MIKNKPIKLLISVVLLSFFIFSNSFIAHVSNLPNTPKTSNSPMQNIVIDGTINEAEWSDGDWKVEFYLDIDEVFNPPDSDGYNYLYLGEDLDNLYIGLDLCSDQTGDETDEWLGVWLNTNNFSSTNITAWENYFNDGAEALIHDIEKDDVYPPFTNILNNWGGVDFNSDNEYNPILGNIEGDYTLLDSGGVPDYFNITSVPNLADQQIWIDFSVDVPSWFTNFGTLFAEVIQEIGFRVRTRVNTTISDQKIIIWYNNGTWNKDDPKQVFEINDDTSWLTESYWFGRDNITVDHKLQFSLYGNHSEPFMTQFDYFDFNIKVNQSNSQGGAVLYPFSSVANYQIEWDFGPSANNASNHRMFEIKIPKNELEHYNPDEDLGIIVGGYGTMVFPNELFWVYSSFKNSIRQHLSANYYYYNMKGCVIPVPSSPILTINTPSPTTSFDINLTYTSSPEADNYTLYRHDSLITSGNLNSATELTTITGTNTIDTVPAIGRWYYAVIANNETGSSDPSNSPYIDVQRAGAPRIPGFPLPYVYLFLLIGISVIFYKKKQKNKS